MTLNVLVKKYRKLKARSELRKLVYFVERLDLSVSLGEFYYTDFAKKAGITRIDRKLYKARALFNALSEDLKIMVREAVSSEVDIKNTSKEVKTRAFPRTVQKDQIEIAQGDTKNDDAITRREKNRAASVARKEAAREKYPTK